MQLSYFIKNEAQLRGGGRKHCVYTAAEMQASVLTFQTRV